MQAENEGGATWVCVRQWAKLHRAAKISNTNAGHPVCQDTGLSGFDHGTPRVFRRAFTFYL